MSRCFALLPRYERMGGFLDEDMVILSATQGLGYQKLMLLLNRQIDRHI